MRLKVPNTLKISQWLHSFPAQLLELSAPQRAPRSEHNVLLPHYSVVGMRFRLSNHASGWDLLVGEIPGSAFLGKAND